MNGYFKRKSAFLLVPLFVMFLSIECVMAQTPIDPIVFKKTTCSITAPNGSTELEKQVWADMCLFGQVSMRNYNSESACPNRDELVKFTPEKEMSEEKSKELVDPWHLSWDFLSKVLFNPRYVAARQTPFVYIGCAIISFPDLSGLTFESNLHIDDSILLDAKLDGFRVSGDLELSNIWFPSTFEEQISAKGISVSGNLNLWSAKIDGGINLREAEIGGYLQLGGAQVDGKLSLGRARIRKGLYLRDKGRFNEVNIENLQLEDDLYAGSSTFVGEFNARGSRIRGDVYLDKANFQSARFDDADIGRNLMASNSSFGGEFNLADIHVGNDVQLTDAKFKDVYLRSVHFGGHLNLDGSTVDGPLDLQQSIIDGPVFLRDGKFKSVDLRAAKVGINLEMSDSKFEGEILASNIKVGNNIYLNNSASFNGINMVG